MLAAFIEALRNARWPAALARLDARAARGYALSIAYLLQARLWTLFHGEPRWRALQAGWARDEGTASVREALAGTLAASDRFEIIGGGAAGFAKRDELYARARERVDIATYYLQSDDTGLATAKSLEACVARGVRVRLLVDRYMTFKKTQEVPGMAELLARVGAAGVELKAWHDPRRPYDSNHRKMILVDGRVVLMGGRNFADHYRGEEWRDADLVLEGDSVAPLAALFEEVWQGCASAPESAHSRSPWLDRVPADIAADPMMRFLLSAVGAATRTVDLELAYFVAHDSLCGALERAARRGVRVRLLTNSAESNDLPYAVWTTYEGARRLLEAGCAVHARRGAGRTLHCKYAVVDGEWASFGSHNLDYYSARYCCETNLVVRDARLGAMLGELFESGLAEAPALSLEGEVRPWLARSGMLRTFDRVFRDFQ